MFFTFILIKIIKESTLSPFLFLTQTHNPGALLSHQEYPDWSLQPGLCATSVFWTHVWTHLCTYTHTLCLPCLSRTRLQIFSCIFLNEPQQEKVISTHWHSGSLPIRTLQVTFIFKEHQLGWGETFHSSGFLGRGKFHTCWNTGVWQKNNQILMNLPPMGLPSCWVEAAGCPVTQFSNRRILRAHVLRRGVCICLSARPFSLSSVNNFWAFWPISIQFHRGTAT